MQSPGYPSNREAFPNREREAGNLLTQEIHLGVRKALIFYDQT